MTHHGLCEMTRVVSIAARMLEAPDLGASPAARWTSTGRVAAAGTLVLGAAFQLAAFITEPKHDETIDRLRWIANSPDRADLAKTFDLVAMPFLLGTARSSTWLLVGRAPATS